MSRQISLVKNKKHFLTDLYKYDQFSYTSTIDYIINDNNSVDCLFHNSDSFEDTSYNSIEEFISNLSRFKSITFIITNP